MTDFRQPPMAMDRLKIGAYIVAMFSRFLAILAILSIAVVTIVTSAHVARMNSGSNGAVHAIAMTQAHGSSDPDCGGAETCGTADSGICSFVCAGLSVYLVLPLEDAGGSAGPGRPDLPSAMALISRTPDLSARPPKLTLL